jgi:hypothetical protein
LKETKKKHNQVHPLYATWLGMRERCYNPEAVNFRNYGGRGIKVCARWSVFANFVSDMGNRPEGTTLDRFPDVNGNYAPDNCRWATIIQQARNRRNNRLIEYNGRTQCLAAWIDELGVDREVVKWRLAHGWTVERAFTEPVSVRRRNATGDALH